MFSFWLIPLVSLFALPYYSEAKLTADCLTRIVGGTETDIKYNPWQIALYRRDNSEYEFNFVCGGSIIGHRWVLTAAHCLLKDTTPSDLFIRAGSSFYARGGLRLDVKRIIVHEKFNKNIVHDYDYALIELIGPLEYTDSINKIPLPGADVKVPEGTHCQITGWGFTNDSQESRDRLRLACVPRIKRTICTEKYSKTRFKITPRMECAGYDYGGQDSCQGDSGGPFTCRIGDTRFLIGVVSFGIGCASKSYAGVNARVPAVRDWIKEYSGI